jgi:catechol 2,3-dioxygenase-like lactoylglutathione lyase family enzyme
VHTLVYAEDADAARAFFKDVLGLPHVEAGPGWLIFATGPSELGVHPASTPHHEISFVCDDLAATMAELTAKGATFTREPSEERWGVTTTIRVPGAGEIMLYQPKHPTAYPR